MKNKTQIPCGVTDKLYFTSDGLAFFDEQKAHSHAARLDDKAVIARTRDEVYKDIPDPSADNWESEMEELLEGL